MNFLRTATCVLVLVATAACRTTKTTTPPGLADAVVLQSSAVRAWALTSGENRCGFVVRFEEPGTAARAWFSVRNTYAQEVGIVDIEGRAWRYRPHQRDPEWLGSGTVQAGACRILEADPAAVLREIPVDEVAQSAHGEADDDVDSKP